MVRSVPPLSYDPNTIQPLGSGASPSDAAIAMLGKRLSSHRHVETSTLIAVALFGAGFSALIFGVPAYLFCLR